MASKFSKYEDKWEIITPANLRFRKLTTPSFAPLPGNNVTFRFEASCEEISFAPVKNVFRLKLLKLSSACISPTLEVNVKVNYSDGFGFESHDLISEKIDRMNAISFKDVIRTMPPSYGNLHYINTFIIKFKMTFSDKNQTTPIEYSNEVKSNKYSELIRNLKSMYEPSVLSDFTFNVEDKSFPAHKFVLAAHSPVFKNMMTHEFLESKTNSVTITDATPEIFDSFLRYFYSGELEDKSWDSLKELYYLADKYDVGFLKIECTDAIISSLSLDVVCEVLKFAYSYCDSVLKAAAINFAVNNIKDIVPREDWKELVQNQPMLGYEVTVNFIPA